MGNPKQKWTSEEEEALRAGVAKHGTGKWKNIQKDPEFNHFLHSRSNIDLKDKWRNMSVSANGQGPREKSRTPKAKPNPNALDTAATPLLITQGPASSTSAALEASTDAALDDSSKCSLDGKTASKYNAMIFEALSTLNDPNGTDNSAIVCFIEQSHEVPQNFRRLLSSRLRRLVAQDKLEKVQNCYRIKKDVLPGANAPTPQQKEIRPRLSQPTSACADTELGAAKSAAYKIAVAENKEFVAAEAGKESERVSKMAEDTNSMLQFAQDVLDKCTLGEIVLMA